jgi:hypothetical protein
LGNLSFGIFRAPELRYLKKPWSNRVKRGRVHGLREEIGRNKNLIDFKGHMCYKHGSPNEEKQFIIIILQ